MNQSFITFRSVTFAQRAEAVLRQKNMEAAIQRTPRWMEEQGCGYCLKLWTQDIYRSVELLRNSRIPMRKVYVHSDDGQLEEVAV